MTTRSTSEAAEESDLSLARLRMVAFHPAAVILDFSIALAGGVLLDFVFGDPRKMPHLVRAVGWLAGKGESLAVVIAGRTVFAGFLLWIGITGLCFGLYLGLALWLEAWSHPMRWVFDSIIVFQSIAYRDLVKHVLAVKDGLEENLEAGRQRVSWIVGRDTDCMEEEDVCRAAIESGAENLSDAVIAPLFWAALFGPAGVLVYRIANTLDAIVGHRSDRFEKLGKVSARVDDILNFVPARWCCLLLLKLHQIPTWRGLKPDAVKHPSINAGWPEAAMAHRLQIVIGGRMFEKGKLVQTAEMNEGARQPNRSDIVRATQLMGSTYLKCLIAIAMAYLALSVVTSI